MSLPLLVKPPPSVSAEIALISGRLEKALRTVGEARSKRGITIEEAFIFLAIGFLGVSGSGSGVTIRPVTCVDIATLIKIPRETVRRKVGHLADLKLVAMTTRGVMIEDIEQWRDLAESLLA